MATFLYDYLPIVNMLPKERDPFVDAFVQYLDAVQEATCDKILGEREPDLGKLKCAGKQLVEASAPGAKGTAEKLSTLVNVLEAQGQLISRDYYGIKEVADTLRKFGPHLEKNYGLTLYAGVDSNDDGTSYLEVCLGETVTVEKSPLHSKIFVKNLVEQTCNRLRRGKKDVRRCVGWVDENSNTYYDIEAGAERAMSKWRIFRGLESESEDACDAKLRTLAYGEIFDRFRDDCGGFAKELALNHVGNTAVHEFHHERIVGVSDACRQIREACAYLYNLSNARDPEALFDELYSIYLIRHDSDEIYRSASSLALDYLRKAGYSADTWSSLEPGRTGEASAMISRQAKEALKMVESECSLRKHEDVEELLKPDFDGYGAAVRNAVTSAPSKES